MLQRIQRGSVTLTCGLLIALACVGLVACGYNGSAPSQASSTQSQDQAQPQTNQTVVSAKATLVPPTRGTQPQAQPQAQVQKCGFVHGYGALEVVPQDQGGEQAESCFSQAFQHCSPATLVFITTGLHSALAHTFTIHNDKGACVITDAKQIGAGSNVLGPATLSTCSGMTVHPRALEMLSCGQEGTVQVLGS